MRNPTFTFAYSGREWRRLSRPVLRFAAAGALVALAGGSGCGSKDFGVPSDAKAAEMAQAICAKAYECCTTAQLMSNQAAGTDRATCETMTTQNFKGLLSAISASQDKHRSTYDSGKVAACLDHVRSATCTELQTTNHLSGVMDCDTFATPAVAAGGPCTNDFECIGGWCDTSAAPSGGDGVCRAFVAVGQSCVEGRCGRDALCRADTSVCATLAATGATCGGEVLCASGTCTTTPGASAGTCAAPAADSCFYASGCSLAPGRPTLISMLLSTLIAAAMITRMSLRQRRRRRS